VSLTFALFPRMITVLVYLVIFGVLLYLFNLFVPMDARFKTAVNCIVCLMAFLFILNALGVWSPGFRMR
jgi:hypothetical protein